MKKVPIQDLEVGKMYIEYTAYQENRVLVLTKPAPHAHTSSVWCWNILNFCNGTIYPERRKRTEDTYYYLYRES